MSIKAMKLALEALHHKKWFRIGSGKPNDPKVEAAITALNAAIEAAEKQEPVAWAMDYDIESVLSGFSTRLMGTAMRIESAFPKHRVKLLYTTPPAAQPAQQEPVAWMRKDGTLRFADGKMFAVGQPFYTTPPAQPAPVQEPVAN